MPSVSLLKAPATPASSHFIPIFAALISAAAVFIGPASRSAYAQGVKPTCPQGYVLSGNNCVRTAPVPSCPSGYSFSAGKCVASGEGTAAAGGSASTGPWVFITREVFGVNSAAELDGAKFCAVEGAPSADAAKTYFKDKGLSATHVPADSVREAIEDYQKHGCDVLVVQKSAAKSTASSLKPSGSHLVLPEQIGDGVASPEPPVRPAAPVAPAAPAVPQPDLATSLQAELKRIGCLTGRVDGDWGGNSRVALRRFSQLTGRPLGSEPSQAALSEAQAKGPGFCPRVPAARKPPRRVRKKRCSGITYAYTRGNTCACSGGRVFTGSRCVYPR